MATWSFNIGEWTEAYVFLRLLGNGRIYGAKPDLSKDWSTYIDILNIIRDEPNQIIIFERFMNDNIANIKVSKDNETITIVTAPEVSEYAKSIYESIKDFKKGLITLPEVQKYMESLGIECPKANLSKSAKEKYGTKTDIIITGLNSLDQSKSTEGFSIKSHVGQSATLFNSSQTSGFTFEVTRCNERLMHKINAKDDFISIIKGIKENGCELVYVKCRNGVFEQNISIVDSQMYKVLSTALLVHAGYFDTLQSADVQEVCKSVIRQNPVGIGNPDFFYPAKFKEFLFDSFAGLTASRVWNGVKRLSGGYIDVNRDGEMLYYRAISDEVFGNYLYTNTYFDRPDRGWRKDLAVAQAQAFLEGRSLSEDEIHELAYVSAGSNQHKAKKGDYGFIYESCGQFFMDLNFQIRFR